MPSLKEAMGAEQDFCCEAVRKRYSIKSAKKEEIQNEIQRKKVGEKKEQKIQETSVTFYQFWWEHFTHSLYPKYFCLAGVSVLTGIWSSYSTLSSCCSSAWSGSLASFTFSLSSTTMKISGISTFRLGRNTGTVFDETKIWREGFIKCGGRGWSSPATWPFRTPHSSPALPMSL